ncbi:MAG TPA: prephenate dehydratase [Blastocatellia bacterium]|nr:prephenate dehydratase [Blastocatellia bacterium]
MTYQIHRHSSNQSKIPRVAYQGEPGAFSGEAARRLFREEVEIVPCETFEKMFSEAENETCDYCLAPIENSLYGSVYQNYDLLLKHNLQIVGETYLRIVHHLMAAPETKIEDVKRVYSHPVALGQCLRFFNDHPKMRPVAAYDTAGSVKMIMENREEGAAAIAGAMTADYYGARVLAAGIEDNRQNYTRFLLLSHNDRGNEPPADADKTSIVFALGNQIGSLYRAMAVFALRDIDLTKIESRPLVGQPWEYSFYLDFIGHMAEPRVRNALAHLGEFATTIKVLGCYRRAPRNSDE